jgi:Fe-S cluster assembly ATP-binding protein
MLKITNLSVNVAEIDILKNINLEVNAGEIHAILGPNGAGKSSLANAISGHPEIIITKGRMSFNKKSLLKMAADERSRAGIFMTFQDPPEIPGVSNLQLTRDIIKARGDTRDSGTIINDYKKFVKQCDLGSEWGKRDFNLGASGGEKKKNEVLMMQMIDPSLLILDEIDSGLDIDAVQQVTKDIKAFLAKEGKACIIITHQPTILDTIKPTHVHIIVDGKIVESGDITLVKRISKNGYREFS